ncbi:SurA N-terminal domain-containing protein [Candidatus Schmidhempelia bombi]|nr:SurA N-terminal domain-containing protein [Candidatus Schmidhempelia bombi]
MMEKIRTAANNVVVKIIFGLIILSFIFAGVGGIFTMNANTDKQYIAKVDGEGLSRIAYENAALSQIQQYHLTSDQPELIQLVRQNVLQQQIQDHLVYKYLDKLDIKVTNEQVKSNIRRNPAFAKDGRFNNELFLNTIKRQGYPSADIYAEYLRQQMRMQQLFSALQLTDFVLPVDADLVKLHDQQRVVATATLSAKDLGIADKSFTDEELKAYYLAHPQQFTTNTELVKLDIVRLPRSAIEAGINITDEDINTYYEQHKKSYVTPPEFAYSSIETENLADAEAIYQQLVSGADFAELAAEKGLYPMQRNTKGVLGWFSAESLPESLKAANLTDIGQFSKPLKQENGHYLIVKLDDQHEQQTAALESIKDVVKNDLLQSMIDQQIQDKEKQIHQFVEQGLSLSDIAGKLNRQVEQTTWINQHTAPLTYSAVGEIVMQQLDEDSTNRTHILGPVYADENQEIYAVQIMDYRPIGLATFESVKLDILAILQKQDRDERFRTATEQLMTKLSSQDAETKAKLTFTEAQLITRQDTSLDKDVIKTAFNLVPSVDNKPVYGITYLPQERAVITQLTQVKEATEVRNMDDNMLEPLIASSSKAIVTTLTSQAKIELMPTE